MVRETRHLWVGNLPDNIREERIREHFKRYGRVQNVKLLGRQDNASTGVVASSTSGICATVAFMDIKSASKAHNAEHVLDERTLTTEYYEPAAIPSTTGAPSAGSSPAGSGYSGSSSSVNSVPVPSSAQRYHLSGGEDSSGATTCPLAASAAAPATWRGTNDSATDFCRRGSNTPATYGRYQRNNTTAPYSTPPSNVERTTPHHRWYASSERAGATGGESTPSTPGGGTESGRRRRHSGSVSSRSDSSSPEPSDTSRASTPATQPTISLHNNHRLSTTHQWASTASGRPLAICVRNLPTRSTDSSLKDGLYHEYKKHGKVVWVKVVGQNADRYAVVRFKKPSDVEKALEVSQDKLFFGCKISVAPHQSCDDDAESAKPYETDIDEYHPKATRTLFIGNLEKDVTQQQLRDKFKHFGRIIEIDIKKGSGGGAGYAFCQYASISSVVEAIRAMDGEYVGGSRVKLGFGKPVATACVWVDGLTEHTEKQVLGAVSRCGAATSVCVDRAAGAALVHFEQAAAAGAAVRELRRVAAAASAAEPDHPRLCVDYASRECQDAFYEQLEKHGGSAALAGSERLSGELSARYIPSTRHESLRYDGCGSRSRASSYGRSTSRTPRYSAVEHYDPVDYAADRRYRVYDEQGSSPPPEDVPYEDRLQSVVVSPHRARRHRRDSSPEDRKHSKERRRSSGGVMGSRRSRSGSGGRVGHARRRHRRRREGSGSRSRAGTPLRDELDAPPAEPRRPPRDRPPLPMCLPLPKFAAQLLRTAQPQPRPHPPPAPAPDSPPRPPSASSSSAGEAPHSPSLEERIRSLDEKYEKWSGSRTVSEAPDRARLRHRLLEVDINEVKPSEVVRSLLAKRSVFDEDSERLEGAVRAPSPTEGGRGQMGCLSQRSLRYCFSSQPAPPPQSIASASDFEGSDRPADPRLNRLERSTCRVEKLCKINESDYAVTRPRPRTPSTDRSFLESSGRVSPLLDAEVETRSKDSPCTSYEIESKMSFDSDEKDGFKISDKICSPSDSKCDNFERVTISAKKSVNEDCKYEMSKHSHSDEKCARDVVEMLLKKVENNQRIESLLEHKANVNKKLDFHTLEDNRTISDTDASLDVFRKKIENCKSREPTDKTKEDIQNLIKSLNPVKSAKEKPELNVSNPKHEDLNITNQLISQTVQNIKLEKENIQIEKTYEIDTRCNSHSIDEKHVEDRRKEYDKAKHNKERGSKDKYENDQSKNNRSHKNIERDRKSKEDNSEKSFIEFVKNEKHSEKLHRDKNDHSSDKNRLYDEKFRNEHHRKDKCEKDKKKESDTDFISSKQKKDEKYKQEKSKKDDLKREAKKETDVKSRKFSRDESSRDIFRKDSTDSSTSRASFDSNKIKDTDNNDNKDDPKDTKPRVKLTDMFVKLEVNKESQHSKDGKSDLSSRIKADPRDDKNIPNSENLKDVNTKSKSEGYEKQRHYSLDSPSETKRKERLNSCSSLPSNIGHKRRISSHDNYDSLNDEVKKSKNDLKTPDRRDSKEARSGDRHKTAKFNKGHFAKLIENKTKDDKKNQVKPPDDTVNGKETKNTNMKGVKKSSKEENDGSSGHDHNEDLQNNLDFLALLELRSSEEDEKQKALRKEMKEKKRLQQLQQIQELQMQQDALQQIELLNKMKDDRKQKTEEKRREANREKRFSTDRKSRDEKIDTKRKNRKQVQTSDSSDSDEPKKHSIFDIIDDGPTYISMYDKVKARSCKNMQKQEEEKRQEKIKAKFSQLKQSRAKREEKKRSSWDEDSDSENDVRRKPHKSSLEYSSDDGSIAGNIRKCDKLPSDNADFDDKSEEYSSTPNDEDQRNKLSRKNSRSRIISDSSDDDLSNKKNPFINDSVCERPTSTKVEENKKYSEESVKKNTLINLFGKSDSEDNKLKPSIDSETYNSNLIKALCNDLSSESESVSMSRNTEVRRKHKKKQKKYRPYSDEDNKVGNSDSGVLDLENKYKISEKQHRHGMKKDKRKDKIRESNDTDEGREEKFKTSLDRKSVEEVNNEYTDILTNNIRRDGKMEDIFGPLSDDSEKDSRQVQKTDFTSQDFSTSTGMNTAGNKVKESHDSRRKKDKKRKLKRWLREDENSLDMDAVSKAIEERLFAETLTEDDNRKCENFDELKQDTQKLDENNEMSIYSCKQDKLKKDNKEKRKKKKRNKDEKQIRTEHDSYQIDVYSKSEHEHLQPPILETISIPMLLDIPLPNDDCKEDKGDDSKSTSMSPSLPRLAESPPIPMPSALDNDNESSQDKLCCENNYIVESKDIEIEQIPMPPPYETIVQDISEVPLPSDPEPIKNDSIKTDIKQFEKDEVIEEKIDEIQDSENANKKDLDVENVDNSPVNKMEKKVEEKPRAIISQEETEDAVAALLGESFGGKTDTFTAYEEPENNPSHQNDSDSTILGTENIPEEDAEEMRQAVQNLNALEMEMKPDTPVSDNDILLIDTDTEEVDESAQDSIEKLPVNIIPTSNQNVNTNNTQVKTNDECNVKPIIELSTTPESGTTETSKPKENDTKIQLARRDSCPVITSTATPVITSWTLTSNKSIEPHVINLQPAPCNPAQAEKQNHVNVLQIKQQPNQSVQVANVVKPVLTPARVSTPYQVINHMVRPHNSTMQPPTIKIPESHVLYQKPPGIVISPRIGEHRMHSPKSSSPGESMTSPRMTNMTLLTTTPQNINSSTVLSPNSMHQRSPGQVTVVRMQQPPLSPIQTLHMPHGARTVVSPNRPNSVLVQGTPLHFNRLPVTPVLTPISKQLNVTNTQQPKTIAVNTSPLIVHQKVITGDIRKNERTLIDTKTENTKIILSPSSLQHSTNPTLMAQNRLIYQNTVNINSALHNIGNKVLINKISPMTDKRESQHLNHVTFSSTPIIHVAGINSTSSTSIIQSGAKTVVCSTQDGNMTSCRGPNSSIVHTMQSQRVMTPAPTSNIKTSDSNGQKVTSSVLSLPPIRSTTVLNKIDSTNITLAQTKAIDAPTLIKTNIVPLRTVSKGDKDMDFTTTKIDPQPEDRELKRYVSEISIDPDDTLAKCETDFEELLKDNTNEIKVTNDPEKKLEINVGKTTTLITAGVSNNEICNKHIEYSTVRKDLSDLRNIGEEVLNDKENNKQIDEWESNESTNFMTSQETFHCSMDTSMREPVNSEANHIEKKIDDTKSENTCDEIGDIKANEVLNVDARNQINCNTNDSVKEIVDSEGHLRTDKDDWNINDLNTVIKKVESVSNEILQPVSNITDNITEVEQRHNFLDTGKIDELDNSADKPQNYKVERNATTKRGGRSVRGKKSQRNLERVQTRQISKSSRGTVTKRGRGRAKLEKSPKNIGNCSVSLPGDVYDFHEDSGDETATSNKTSSTNKNEPRPRLILTIKSPLSGHAGITATSTLSIAQRDQSKNIVEKVNREEKIEDFISPLTNTRKSRRLLEKDVNRSGSADDASTGDDSSGPTNRPGKRRPTRQVTTGKSSNSSEKQTAGNETRKSPRGSKRSRDRSLSDASLDSADGDGKKDETPREPKVARLEERSPVPPMTNEVQSADLRPAAPVGQPPPVAPAAPPAPPNHNPTPIIKPPKKMISEISAKLAAFEGGVQQHRVEAEGAREPPCATGEAQAGDARRALDCIGGAMMPVGATEASDARVQSPALPHRPPPPIPTGRATPLIFRGGESEGAGRYRAGAPSLPRGAHLPAHPDAPHTPHHHHAGAAASRITSVPALSPQGQITLSADLVRSPPPAHQQTSPIASGDGMYPHFSHQHYQMYQQHFRATQHEARTTPSPFTRTLEAEGSEAPTPPLELRRPPSARVPRPAHSPSPADRHIMYGVGCGRSPPPAHLSGGCRSAGALPPSPAPGPPHASQVPREADSLQMLLRRYPVMWQGLLALKNDSAAVQMHFVGGNPGVAGDTLARHSELAPPLLRIAQRMRLEPAQLDQVHRKMKLENEHCILLALPCGRDHMDVLQQSTNLTAGFITYLQRKQAAGIVNIAPPGHHQAMYTVHIFPSCDFANENLNRIAPDLMHRVADIAHLLIVIATV